MKEPIIFLLLLLCIVGCKIEANRAEDLRHPRQSLGDIIILQRNNLVARGLIPSNANLTAQDALYSAQMLAVFMEVRYGANRLEEFSDVEVSYHAEERGREWNVVFSRSPAGPSGPVTVWVDDKTGKGVDYLAGD